MPVHDWTRVEAGIFHHFHQEWIPLLCRRLNDGLLPADHYALVEQETGDFGPDVLALKTLSKSPGGQGHLNGASQATLIKPHSRFIAESPFAAYLKKQSWTVVRHVSDDQLVAVVEILSQGNKSSRRAFQALLDKAFALLQAGIHLLLVDLFPPTSRDPQGIHATLWEEATGIRFEPPAGKPLTLASYEAGDTLRAFVEPVAVGEILPAMPLLLRHDAAVAVPLEETYYSAFEGIPRRWREALE
jgi:Protein of unknown function (DUF4058)